MHRTKVRVVEDALDANNTIAGANRSDFERSNVTVVNLMSAPGAGKTTLLEAGLAGLDEEGLRVGVLEGDVQGSFDADRLSVLHIPVVQLNTDNGFGGECHLDANMVRSALPAVPLDDIDVLIVENVGNLVCPAEFRIGEDSRIMVCSVTEGEDKPLKYPLMFRACELVVINKVDLLQHLDFDVDRLEANIKQVNHEATVMRVSAKTGEGVEEFRDVAEGAAGADRGRDGARSRSRARRSRSRARSAHPHARPRRPRARNGMTQAPSGPPHTHRPDMRPTETIGAERVEALLRARSEANAAFFEAEAERLARLCHKMAERFAREGRLVAFGATPADRSDARHVAVEFVHPVIVGKSALPALAIDGAGGPSPTRSRWRPRARTSRWRSATIPTRSRRSPRRASGAA